MARRPSFASVDSGAQRPYLPRWQRIERVVNRETTDDWVTAQDLEIAVEIAVQDACECDRCHAFAEAFVLREAA